MQCHRVISTNYVQAKVFTKPEVVIIEVLPNNCSIFVFQHILQRKVQSSSCCGDQYDLDHHTNQYSDCIFGTGSDTNAVNKHWSFQVLNVNTQQDFIVLVAKLASNLSKRPHEFLIEFGVACSGGIRKFSSRVMLFCSSPIAVICIHLTKPRHIKFMCVPVCIGRKKVSDTDDRHHNVRPTYVRLIVGGGVILGKLHMTTTPSSGYASVRTSQLPCIQFPNLLKKKTMPTCRRQ